MQRILLLLVLGWILYRVIKHLTQRFQSHDTSTKQTSEKIVACSQCGLHVPESETSIVNNEIVCQNPKCNDDNENGL